MKRTVTVLNRRILSHQRNLLQVSLLNYLMYLIYLQRKAGGGGHPDPEISGGGGEPGLKKNFFRPLGPHRWIRYC